MSANQQQHPQYPWRLDTNSRYRDAMKIVLDLSTASLILPIFFLKDILSIPKDQPLIQYLNLKIYLSWICLTLAICCAFVFFYASGKWVRLAWGQSAGFFRRPTTDKVVEMILDLAFVGAVLLFLLGVGLTLWFVVTFRLPR